MVEPETMSIRSGLKFPSGWPLTVLELKLAVPKFVSGSTPPELDGASAIASAEASRARRSSAPPPLQSAEVPVCSTVLLPSPSSPTQKLVAAPARGRKQQGPAPLGVSGITATQ
jgi:hypothetical protein